MKTQIAYKIVEKENGEIRTLFHGVNGSRLIPDNTWLQADMKIVRDGTAGTEYTSGWHVFKCKECAKNYLSQKFRKRVELLKVVGVEIKGPMWEKVHSPADVYLAEWLRLR